MAAGIARRRTASSSLTSMRSAWKVRLAGCPPVRRAGAGISAYSSSTSRPEVVNGSRSRSRTTAVAILRANFSSPYSRRIRVSSPAG